MGIEVSRDLLLLAAGIFLLGWVLGSMSARLAARYRTEKRDPRDARIRSLEAELRVSHANLVEATESAQAVADELKQAKTEILSRDTVITEQLLKAEQLKTDLQNSVRKTRELRNELSDRAAESVKSDAKLKEVETELSMAHASTDMLATGVLDYSEAPPKEDSNDTLKMPVPPWFYKSGR